MGYKIVFSDIDGTLLNKDRELSAPTIQAIKKLKEKVPFILISARMPAAMKHLQQQLDILHLPLICYNGGLVLVDNEPVSSTEIPLEIADDLVQWNSRLNCHLSLYNNEEWYVPEFDEWAKREENNTKITPQVKSNSEVIAQWGTLGKGVHKIMAMGKVEEIDQIRDFLKDKYGEQLHLYRSKDTYLEIAPKSISKYSAIELLLEKHFGLLPEEAIAIGDNYNDVEMLKNIGYGIAVGNAREECIEAANVVAGKSIEDGVAEILNQIFKH